MILYVHKPDCCGHIQKVCPPGNEPERLFLCSLLVLPHELALSMSGGWSFVGMTILRPFYGHSMVVWESLSLCVYQSSLIVTIILDCRDTTSISKMHVVRIIANLNPGGCDVPPMPRQQSVGGLNSTRKSWHWLGKILHLQSSAETSSPRHFPGWWYTYLWKIWVRQMGWWHSQNMESHKSHVPVTTNHP